MTDRKQRGKRTNSGVSSSSSSSTSSFSSDDDDADAVDLKPIRGYLSNRRELSRQLFKSVKTEKIRMMLPQLLKNMNLAELEEWCASELCGMSEARILCILNGQPMLDSSDTDTDDSGPSLEIISDTEEWLTDTDVAIKEEPSSSGAKKSKRIKANRGKGKAQTKAKAKSTVAGNSTVDCDVMVKTEKDNRASTNKEGESLLDLLELEMRARAIRALIRKEEDVIPSAASEKRMAMTANALRNTLNSAVSASLSNEKSLNGKFNLGESAESSNDKSSVDRAGRSAKVTETCEDEDVVFVVAQPTPTIELLSSDNENDDDNEKNNTKDNKNENTKDEATEVSGKSGRQISSKNEKNREVATTFRDSPSVSSARIVTIDKVGDGPDNLKIVITKRLTESSSSPSTTKSSKAKKNSMEQGDKFPPASGSENSNEKKIVEATQTGTGLFKKIKKKPHLRSKRKVNREEVPSSVRDQVEESRSDALPSPAIEANKLDSEKKDEEQTTEMPCGTTVKLEKVNAEANLKDASSNADVREARRKILAARRTDEERLDDFEEIIDLDACSDDMDEMDNNDSARSTNEDASVKQNQVVESPQKTLRDDTKETAESAETWASRYYQTDDVQNVIKESKIQSEIRKRLRERQRLSKLNSSPKLNVPGDAAASSEKSEKKCEAKPTGSVQEYLALKNASASPVESNELNNENPSLATEPSKSTVDESLPTNNPIENAETDLVVPEPGELQ